MDTLRTIRSVAIALIASAATATSQDAVLQWNDAALNAIRAASTPPPPATRILAILHTSMHDAVNGIQPRYEQYLVTPNVPKGASKEAAASAAARDVLASFYPTQVTTFNALHNLILSKIKDGAKKTQGVAWGQSVASQILAARANDGSANTAPYPGSNEPGKWRPHLSFGGLIRPALLPLWGKVKPFALQSASQFQPPPPPALLSMDYAVDVLVTQFFGSKTSLFRSPDDTQIAQFWSYGPATCTPAGHWNQIAAEAARGQRGSLAENARLFALLNVAMADGAIACWDCKYLFGLWRPITAIQLADQDGNPLTTPDTNWSPLLETPPFPEYTSGHSTFSGAAFAVLATHFGTDNISFSVGSDDLPYVRRKYTTFSQAAWESGLSRIYGGIHFMTANMNGLLGGYQTGIYAVDHVLRRLPSAQ